LAFQWQRVIKLHFQEKTDGRESVSAIRSLPDRLSGIFIFIYSIISLLALLAAIVSFSFLAGL
jgi:hypothetical protein